MNGIMSSDSKGVSAIAMGEVSTYNHGNKKCSMVRVLLGLAHGHN